jgi:phospholipid/cholesterol/gamma-HCH transport system ATP-binding protein
MADPDTVPGGAVAAEPPVVEVVDLVARYEDQVVLNGVSLAVRRGEVMVILGGSGSGKSTLLKCLLGIHKPESGTLRILGVDMVRAPERERETVYKQIGMVYQSGALFGSLSVQDNVALPLREHTPLDEKIVEITVRMKLGLVGLSGFGHRLPSQLSGGQAKRAAFARAIALDPLVLFCDEPSAGLDPRVARGIDDLIRNLNQAFHMAVVVVTHEMESVKVIADRIAMLAPRAGGAQVVFNGTYAEMQASEDPVVRDFARREPIREPRREAGEILRQLVGDE